MTSVGFRYIRGALTTTQQKKLARAVLDIVRVAPFFRPTMPRSGKPFSVSMTNAGSLGWVSDKSGGYRYQETHPTTGRPWPTIPPMLLELWQDYADYAAPPQACLINHYEAGSRMGSHQDRDEADLKAPVLSVSLGDDAVFHVGGRSRSDAKTRMTLHSGDVVVLARESRLAFHGIDRVFPGSSALLPQGGRFNLTLRRVTLPADAKF